MYPKKPSHLPKSEPTSKVPPPYRLIGTLSMTGDRSYSIAKIPDCTLLEGQRTASIVSGDLCAVVGSRACLCITVACGLSRNSRSLCWIGGSVGWTARSHGGRCGNSGRSCLVALARTDCAMVGMPLFLLGKLLASRMSAGVAIIDRDT
jgi:hypothetical protein